MSQQQAEKLGTERGIIKGSMGPRDSSELDRPELLCKSQIHFVQQVGQRLARYQSRLLHRIRRILAFDDESKIAKYRQLVSAAQASLLEPVLQIISDSRCNFHFLPRHFAMVNRTSHRISSLFAQKKDVVEYVHQTRPLAWSHQ